MAVTVAQLKETEISTCEGKGQTELTTLSLWFELAELGAGGGGASKLLGLANGVVQSSKRCVGKRKG